MSGDLKGLLAEWKALVKPLQSVSAVKLGSADGLVKLQRALDRVPTGDALDKAFSDLRKRISEAMRAEREQREKDFRRSEAELVQELRKSQLEFKELESSWRIGPLELELRRDQCQARACYNREVVISWRAVLSKEDLSKILEDGRQTLERKAIPAELLIESLWEAYEQLAGEEPGSAASTGQVALLDLYKEFRISLVRAELHAGRPDRKLTYADLPRWAFLYNLDLYRAFPSQEKGNKNLAFVPGSQQDTSKGKGVLLDGLAPSTDYKTACYVKPG